MGYTHYWKFKTSPKDIENGLELFKSAVKATAECISRLPKRIPHEEYEYNSETKTREISRVGYLPFRICGGNGYGEPVFSDTLVCFNGDAALGHDHETCCIEVGDRGSDFCKTARKPYDVAVCITLLCFKHFFGDNFEFSSDGDIEGGEEGWKQAKEITKDHFA